MHEITFKLNVISPGAMGPNNDSQKSKPKHVQM